MSDNDAIEIRKDVTYATHDGVRCRGDLYLPRGAGPVSGACCGPRRRLAPGCALIVPVLGPHLAARGYALYAISYRLAGKGKKTYPQAVNDVCAAVQFVRGEAQGFQSRCGAHRLVRRVGRGASGEPFGARRRELLQGLPERQARRREPESEGAGRRSTASTTWPPTGCTSRRRPRPSNPTDIFIGMPPMQDREALFRSIADQLRDFRQQRVAVFLSWGTRGRSRRQHAAIRGVLAGAQAGRFLRAHRNRAGRAALLVERPDRRAGQLLRFPGAASRAFPGRAPVSGARR